MPRCCFSAGKLAAQFALLAAGDKQARGGFGSFAKNWYPMLATRDQSLKTSRLFTVACPFGQAVVHVEYPGCVEYVTLRLECLGYYGWCPEIEERRKPEPHFSSLISDRCAAKTAADFAGQNSLCRVQIAVEEPQMFQPRTKSDVVLVEYGGPLHRCTMQLLAHDAVTNFRVHGIAGNVISNRAAVTAGFVSGVKIHIVGTQEEFFEFIHRFVSSVGCDLFYMRVFARTDAY